MQLYQVTYQVQNSQPITVKGLTEAGLRDFMNAILRAGGSAVATPLPPIESFTP